MSLNTDDTKDKQSNVTANSVRSNHDQVAPIIRDMLKPIMMRRLKTTLDATGKKIIDLPKKHVYIVYVDLCEMERDFYDRQIEVSVR